MMSLKAGNFNDTQDNVVRALAAVRSLGKIQQLLDNPAQLAKIAQYVHTGAIAMDLLPDLHKAMENPTPASGNATDMTFPGPDTIMGIPTSLFMNLFTPPQLESQRIEQYNYSGFGGVASKCGIRIQPINENRTVIHLYHLADGGTSPVNIIDRGLADRIFQEKIDSIPADRIVWKIHTPNDTGIVNLKWNGRRFIGADFAPDPEQTAPPNGALGNFTLDQWNRLQAHRYWIGHASGAVTRALTDRVQPVQGA